MATMTTDASEILYSRKLQGLQIYHVPTGKIVEFKAFITDFADTYNSNWNSETVYGRMDPIATFRGTTREIVVSWTVPAASDEEAKINLQKASLFFSMLYPVYLPSSTGRSGAGQISAAPLLRVKFANLISSITNGAQTGVKEGGLLGYINGGVSLVPDFEQGFHDPAGELYPMAFSLGFTLSVLHTHKLGWKSGRQPLLRSSKGNTPATPQFPYGTPFPKESENKINNQGANDAVNNENGIAGTTVNLSSDLIGGSINSGVDLFSGKLGVNTKELSVGNEFGVTDGKPQNKVEASTERDILTRPLSTFANKGTAVVKGKYNFSVNADHARLNFDKFKNGGK